ncbi:hypothetical protein TeGR_g11761 [Tetraparma gracilis]|uniref:Very-long-chain 3-oxoacyl-CoA synthase n=1 Tax=Tetraparma gracilis TaxID=2962635 RepID=A0ABQ6MME1_9STRA|nr:hypothetical protein TeGR_g11761 [Tetraparma gracilis]
MPLPLFLQAYLSICRNIQETCYADFGIAYDIWLAVMFLIQSSVLVWLYILLKESAAKRKKGAKYSSMEKLMIMNAVATSSACCGTL